MMNKKIITFLSFIAAVSILSLYGCQSGPGSGNAELASQIDSVSYSLGYQNGKFLLSRGMDKVKPEMMMQGFVDAIEESDAILSETEMRNVVQTYNEQIAQGRAQNRQQNQSRENRRKGEEFLAENKTKEGVKVRESGLQYKVVEEGSGASPTVNDTVTVNYEGSLIDGTVFETTFESDDTATFPVARVIRGWTEGLQLMKEGATYIFYIPSDLAYGENPRPGGPIGPNETLIFRVELLEVK